MATCAISSVIIGCESIGGRLGRLSLGEQPQAADWLRWTEDIVQQCVGADVAAYVKQVPQWDEAKQRLVLCKNPALFPEALRRQELPT